jgi:hypothetical protein
MLESEARQREIEREDDRLFLSGARSLTHSVTHPRLGEKKKKNFKKKMKKEKKRSMYANQASKQEEEGKRAV